MASKKREERPGTSATADLAEIRAEMEAQGKALKRMAEAIGEVVFRIERRIGELGVDKSKIAL